MQTPNPNLPPNSYDAASFRQGAMAMMPVFTGLIPFAIIAGALTVSIGIGPFKAFIFSLLLTAGASQLAAVELMGQGAPTLIVIFAGLIINLRFVMYSASVAPYLAGVRTKRKMLMCFLLTDQTYAINIGEFTKPAHTVHWPSFYWGSALIMWVGWIWGILIGIILGRFIPSELGLDFAVPLTLLALLLPVLRDKPSLIVAAVAGVVASIFDFLPYKTGLMVGSAVGIVTGFFLIRHKKKRDTNLGGE